MEYSLFIEISDHVTTHLKEKKQITLGEHARIKKKCSGQSVWSASQSISQSVNQSLMYSKWAATDATDL